MKNKTSIGKRVARSIFRADQTETDPYYNNVFSRLRQNIHNKTYKIIIMRSVKKKKKKNAAA